MCNVCRRGSRLHSLHSSLLTGDETEICDTLNIPFDHDLPVRYQKSGISTIFFVIERSVLTKAAFICSKIVKYCEILVM